MNLLLLNQPWFVPELRAMGHTAISVGHYPHFDIKLIKPVTHINEILMLLPASKRPDLILILDNSSPLTFTGFSEIDIPIVFISVDTFHHIDLHSDIAQFCDVTFAAQKVWAQEMNNRGVDAKWLPLWLSNKPNQYENENRRGAAFIGTLDASLNPRRVRFFERLKKLVDVDVFSANWLENVSSYEMMINQSVKDDLNFRVFETMGSNRLLLTERTNNGLDEIFDDGKHLLTYEPDNEHQAAEIIKECLGNLEKTRAISQAGFEEVQNKHLPEHRIETIITAAEKSTKPYCSMTNYIDAKNLSLLSYLWERNNDMSSVRITLECALNAFERAIKANEQIVESLASHAILVSSRYDHLFAEKRGKEILDTVERKNPGFIEVAFSGVNKLFQDAQKYADEKDELRKSLGF